MLVSRDTYMFVGVRIGSGILDPFYASFCDQAILLLRSSSFFFVLLFHQLADDEALIIFLQTSLFLVCPYAADNCMSLF